MIDKLQSIIDKYNKLSDLLSDPNIISNTKKFAKIAKEHSSLNTIVEKSKIYIDKIDQLKSTQEILDSDDDELASLAKEELSILSKDIADLEQDLKILLIPKDPNDNNNTILEIRSGTGGDEAALFAEDLMRMYTRYVERMKWSSEMITLHHNEGGGIKEAVISIKGLGAYGNMKFESGVHRVQRVPDTESSGRLHTSAATVAVLPEIEDLDMEIKDGDIKIDTYRASGAGGQHVNTTDSAVRITHIPSGIVVQCQSDRSQHKNKSNAMSMLKSRIYEKELDKRKNEENKSNSKKKEIGWGHQIRSYVLHPYKMIKDLRTNYESSNVNNILNGDIDKFLEKSLTL